MILEWSDAGRLIAAVAAGALIGIERELHDKPAGFRTNILISIGAAIFTLLSIRIAGSPADESRIAAQVVSGVGFLGAGAVLKSGMHVTGLTTAATIWAVASLGMAFGSGHYFIGTVGTLLVHGVLAGLAYIEPIIDRYRTMTRFEVQLRSSDDAAGVRGALATYDLRPRHWWLAKLTDGVQMTVEVVGSLPNVQKFEAALVNDARVTAFRRT